MPPHVDPDDLALLALGEHLEGVQDAHLEGCDRCRSDLAQLRAVVSTARSVTPADTPEVPPDRVWEAVAAELGLSEGAAQVLPLARPRRARRTWLVAAAAAVAGLLVGVGATALALRSGSDNQVVARTRLAALPAHTGTGAAEVVGTGDSRVLKLDVSGLTRGNGFYEVWLLGADGKRLVSLGLLDGRRARFPLPPQVDVSQFPIVDISLEPADGNPAHSGDSIVRGTLPG